MFRRAISAVVVCAILFLGAPGAVLAYPFGGKASIVWPCFVFGVAPYGTISILSSPNPGLYIWTPATRTYKNGPPAPGKWILGLTSIPYICVVFPVGPIVVPGITIGMMGSSGGGAPLNTFVPPSARSQNTQQNTITPQTPGNQN